MSDYQKSRDRRRPRFPRALLITATNVAFVAILLEVGARVVYPWMRGEDFSWAALREQLRHPALAEAIVTGNPAATVPGAPSAIVHPYLGFVFEPGTATVTRGGEALRYSRFGFFGDAPVFDKKPGEVVVAIGGGSVAGGLWHRGGETLRSALQADPRFQGKTIRLESFALGGFKQPQPLNTLTYLLALGAKIDVWIELDGFNELVLPLSENAPAGVPLIYPRDWRRLAAASLSKQELQTRAEITAIQMERQRWRDGLANSPLAHSAFALAWWDAADRRSSELVAQLAASLKKDTAALPPMPNAANAAANDDDVLRESVEIWKNASVQMARLCQSNGIAYVQFIQPNQYFSGTKTLTDDEKRTAIASGGYRPAAERGYPLLVKAGDELRAQGFPVFDLTTIFKDEPRTIYRDTCCHVNELGNELMAKQIAQALLESPALSRP